MHQVKVAVDDRGRLIHRFVTPLVSGLNAGFLRCHGFDPFTSVIASVPEHASPRPAGLGGGVERPVTVRGIKTHGCSSKGNGQFQLRCDFICVNRRPLRTSLLHLREDNRPFVLNCQRTKFQQAFERSPKKALQGRVPASALRLPIIVEIRSKHVEATTHCSSLSRISVPCRLLEHATEVAHRVHPIWPIHTHPVQDGSQVFRDRPTLVSLPRPVQSKRNGAVVKSVEKNSTDAAQCVTLRADFPRRCAERGAG